MKTKHKGWALFLLVVLSSSLGGQTSSVSCSRCAEWNTPQAPFRVFGNTYYVGTSELTSLLITSGSGHVLIDGALPQSAEQIAANIRTLGFRVEDVKLILNSHAHFDHAGGISELQRLSGARVAASDWSAKVFTESGVAKDDPQYGTIAPIARVSNVERLHDGETLRVGDVGVVAHLTPGHTPGGTSWTWVSCEGDRCLKMVYADSLTPVSSDGYQFNTHVTLLAGFEKSLAFLRGVECDVLLTSHPEVSSQWNEIKAWRLEGKPQPVFDRTACRKLADDAGEQLRERLAKEKTLPTLPASGQERRARLEGIVKEGSQPVAGVLAVVNDYETVWQVKTDAQGAFSFFVPAGCYDMLLSSRMFKPSVKRFCVDPGEVKKMSIRLERASVVRLPLS